MKLYVPTCNQLKHIIKTYSILFNKYWGDHIDVVILCYDEPEDDLPHNFSVVSLGKQEDFPGKDWCSALIPYFNTISDEYFMLSLDDSFLIDYVDEDKVSIMEATVKSGEAQKAMLHSHLNAKYGRAYRDNLIILNSNAPYRTSIHPAIWSKKQFQSFLKPGFTLWDFELKNQPQSFLDKSVLLSYDLPRCNEILINPSNHIFNIANIYRGSTAPDPTGGFKEIRQEDQKLIMEMLDEHKTRTNK